MTAVQSHQPVYVQELAPFGVPYELAFMGYYFKYLQPSISYYDL